MKEGNEERSRLGVAVARGDPRAGRLAPGRRSASGQTRAARTGRESGVPAWSARARQRRGSAGSLQRSGSGTDSRLPEGRSESVPEFGMDSAGRRRPVESVPESGTDSDLRGCPAESVPEFGTDSAGCRLESEFVPGDRNGLRRTSASGRVHSGSAPPASRGPRERRPALRPRGPSLLACLGWHRGAPPTERSRPDLAQPECCLGAHSGRAKTSPGSRLPLRPSRPLRSTGPLPVPPPPRLRCPTRRGGPAPAPAAEPPPAPRLCLETRCRPAKARRNVRVRLGLAQKDKPQRSPRSEREDGELPSSLCDLGDLGG